MTEDCSALAAQITMLQAENLNLVQYIVRLEAERERVKRASETVVVLATEQMNQGQPLGKWSYLKGLRKMAQTILDIVN